MSGKFGAMSMIRIFTALASVWLLIGVARADDQIHWSFQRPIRPKIASVKRHGWPANAIDAFILARLEDESIEPSPSADRATLIRRLSLDLLGLPPTVDEVREFVLDDRPEAYDRLVDRLLASPFHGERWGRHWLDVARYADSNGFTRDFGREMYRYRDWVIQAFNQDMGFDQFTIEQIAGDMLPDATRERLIASGFHRNTLINEEGGTDAEQFRVDAVADRVATTGAAFLGLTLGCARCHEHKYDPISQREYYELFAFFNNCDEPKIETPYDWQVADGVIERRDARRQQIAELERELAGIQAEFDERQILWERTITPEQRAKLPGPTQEALMKTLEDRTADQQQLVAEVFKKTEEARKAFPLVDRIAALRQSEPTVPTSLVMRERADPRETYVHRRGNFLDQGERVYASVPDVLHPLPKHDANPNRLDFARWLVDERNPLTPRVTVNRIWQHYFGRGIVETENDFGTQGEMPTHPFLLDWLATELIREQWSLKRIHRRIVCSATYRQQSNVREDLTKIDPANRLLARQPRLRLEAEIIRDCALSAAGLLTDKIGGPSVYPPQPPGVFEFTQDPKPWNSRVDEDRYRRGMYTFFWRSSPYPSLMVFDFPNSNVTCTRRVRSNTPLQALTLANDLQFIECARALAARIIAHQASPQASIDRLFQMTLAREPSSMERAEFIVWLESQRDAFSRETEDARRFTDQSDISAEATVEFAMWTAGARVLMNVDEFITRP